MCSAWQSWGVGKLLERVEHLVVEDGEVERLVVEDGEVERQTEAN